MTTQNGYRTLKNLSIQAIDDIENLNETLEEHNCIQYVLWLMERKTKKWIAEEGFKISEEGLRQRQMRWAESGLLEKVRQAFLHYRAEAIQIRIDQIVDEADKIYDEIWKLSQSANREDVKLNAGMYLIEKVVDPELAKRITQDDAASQYANSGNIHDPTDIQKPDFLTAGKVISRRRKNNEPV